MHSDTRRSFLKKTLTTSGACAASQLLPIQAQSAKSPTAEKLVSELLDSLTDSQRSSLVLPYSSPLRTRVENNWHILKDKRVADQFDSDQQSLVRKIFRELHSKQMNNQVWSQFLDDNGSKNALTPDQIFGSASVALFQDDKDEPFEFVITGRHCTRRCSNIPDSKVAFGGPIFYGHAPSFYEGPDHKDNAYWFQSIKANELYSSLSKDQQLQSRSGSGRAERGIQTVELKGSTKGLKGLSASDLDKAQQKKLTELVSALVAPFRTEDQTQAALMINQQLADIHIAYFEKDDIGDDGVWDNWQLEGPNMIWYFRGKPHVHVWVHIKQA